MKSFFQKGKRHVLDHDQINQRFNKSLVLRQLRALVDYTDKIKLDRDVDRIHKAWMESHQDPLERPRYFRIDDVLSLSKSTRVLVSEYSTMFIGDHEFENFKVGYHGDVFYAAPITRDIMRALGGPAVVSRMLMVGGVRLIADTLHERTAAELDVDTSKLKATIEELESYYLKELTTIKT